VAVAAAVLAEALPPEALLRAALQQLVSVAVELREEAAVALRVVERLAVVARQLLLRSRHPVAGP
jgi:hypothetical protein